MTEWSNPAGEQFGLKRLLERFVKFRDLPPDEIASSIITDVREFSEFLPCGDDYTLFVIRYKGRPN